MGAAVLRIGLNGIAVALLTLEVSWRGLEASFRALSAARLVAVGGLSLLWTAVHVVRWRIVLRAGGVSLGPWGATRSFCRGSLLGSLTPLQAGELARLVGVEAGDWGRGLALLGVDKALDLASLALVASVSWGFVAGDVRWCLGTVALVVLVASAMEYWGPRAASRMRLRSRVLDSFVRLSELPPRKVWLLFALAIAGYALVLAQYHVVLDGMAEGYRLVALALTPLLMLSRVAPFTFGGLGLTEHLAALLLPRGGVCPDAAFAASLFMFTTNMWIPLLVVAASVRRR